MSNNVTKKKKIKGFENARVYTVKAGTFISPSKTVKGTKFINFSTYPGKIEMDLDILQDVYHEYLPQIANKIGVTVEHLEMLIKEFDSDKIKLKNKLIKQLEKHIEKYNNLIENACGLETLEEDSNLIKRYNELSTNLEKVKKNSFNYKKLQPLFRVSIPIWRFHEGCYCGDLYVSENDFYKGVLIFNKNFGRFNIDVLPQHKEIANLYYKKFLKKLHYMKMDSKALYFACPELGNKSSNIGHFCNVCLKNKHKLKVRKTRKILTNIKELNPVHKKYNIVKFTGTKISSIHAIKEEI